MSNSCDTPGEQQAPQSKGIEGDKSFVRKVKSRVSGLLPTTFSKWFGHGNDDEEEAAFDAQRPSKRAKYYDYPAMNNCTFQEPTSIAGPSGVLRHKKVAAPVNGNVDDHQNDDKDSDSGESTSGYSSMPRIGSKEQVSEVLIEKAADKAATNRSLFNNTSSIQERSLFSESPSNNSLSSRRPSFSTSAFGSPNFMDRTLTTKRIVNSPFYSGRTTYGGASAYNRSTTTSLKFPELQPSFNNFIAPKATRNAASSKNLTLSKTAKRILDTLEQYTTPGDDIKKIPNPSKRANGDGGSSGMLSKYIRASPYARTASARELHVPTMSDLLKMKLKERLQDSTVSVRELATKSKSPLNVEEYKLRSDDTTKPTSAKSTNKMKAKIGSVRASQAAKHIECERVEPVKLPDIALPISTMPSFDFSIPIPQKAAVTIAPPPPQPSSLLLSSSSTETDAAAATTTNNNTVNKPSLMFATTCTSISNKIEKITSTTIVAPASLISNSSSSQQTDRKDFIHEYKFSTPLVLAENSSNSIKAINTFKFSEPIDKKQTHSCTVNNNNNNNNNRCSSEKSSSKLSPFSKPNDPGTWECSDCMIRNLHDKVKCIACEAPRNKLLKPTLPSATPSSSSTTSPFAAKPAAAATTNLFDQFKMPADKWECSCCMIRNDNAASKCVACETPRVAATTTKTVPPVPAVVVTAPPPAASMGAFGGGGFGTQFKMSADMWECEACLVRNSNDRSSCVACTTPKRKAAEAAAKAVAAAGASTTTTASTTTATTTPSLFGGKFLPPPTSWECDTCLVRNEATSRQCVACETPKPGSSAATVAANATPSTFTTSNTSGFGDIFKKKATEWECPSCMVKNGNALLKCQCCESPKPGSQLTTTNLPDNSTGSTIPKFNFGIDKAQLNGHGFAAVAATSSTTSTMSSGSTPSSSLSTSSPFLQPLKSNATTDNTTTVHSDVKNGADPTSSTQFGFTFNNNNKIPNGKKPSEAASSAVTFSFGVKPLAAATTTTTAPSSSTFSSPALDTKAINGDVKEMSTMFKFGSPAATAVTASSTTTAPSATTTPTFSFGIKSAPSTSTATASKSQPSAGSGSIFGAAAAVSNSFGGFGSVVTSSTNNPPPPTAATSLVTSTTNTAATTTSSFTFSTSTSSQSFASAAAAAATAPASSSTTTTTSASSGFNFTFTKPETTAPTFGNNATFGSGTSSSSSGGFGALSSFGAVTSTTTTTPAGGDAPSTTGGKGVFTFGSASASASGATPSKSGFNFGQTAVPPSGGFKFGNTSAPSAGTFNFGAAAAPINNTTFTSFGAPPQPQNGDNKRVIRRALRRTQR